LRNEIELLVSLHHPYIIKPELAFVDDRVNVCVQFPFYEQTSKSWIQGKSMSELRLFYNKLLHVLSFIHSKLIIHRDIKFDNILVTKDGNPIIIDFGVGKKDYFQQTGTIGVGTPYFMAPELEKSHATFSSDVRSFGVMLYDTFYGIGKFSFYTKDNIQFSTLKEDPEGRLVELLRRILKMNPSERPTFQELILDPFFMNDEQKMIKKSKNLLEKEEKIKLVLDSLPKLNTSSVLNLTLNRNNVVDDMIKFFSKVNGMHLLDSTNITFVNEFVVDQGGPTIEMFVLFFTQVFERKELFKSYETSLVLVSDKEGNNLEAYEVIGKLMLKALLHRIPVPLLFSSFVYRFIMDEVKNGDESYSF
jgi:serine/threonine protein kinase